MTIEFHPIANCFPLIDGAEFDELVADIKQHGVREPVVLHEGMILDGRNRYRASAIAGVDCPLATYEGTDPVGFVVSLNLRRRHLNEGQRAWVAAKLANLEHGGAREDQGANLRLANADAARMMNVSERSVDSARVVRDHGVTELQDKVASGAVAPSTAADVARLPAQEQREIVARGEKEILEAAKQIRIERSAIRQAQNDSIARREIELPAGKFETIVIDPPWQMEKIERDVTPNQVGFDYPTMTEEQLLTFGEKVAEMAADDCHIFMWTTHKFLPMALRLLDAYGFRYVLTMVWHKSGGFQPYGLPQYNCEFAIYARRGFPKFIDTKAFSTCFEGPRREHSRKPKEFYEVIQRVTSGPRVDVFSREIHDGFSQVGNEVDLFSKVAAA